MVLSRKKLIGIGLMAVSGIAMMLTVSNLPLITKILIPICTAVGFAGWKLYEKG